MNKILSLIFLITIASFSYAQKGDIKIGVGADLGIPYDGFLKYDSKTGFGGYIKGLKPIGKSGQLTFTTGYSSFPGKETGGPSKVTHSIFSLLPGYRHSFKGFYIEPQVGYGNIHSKLEPSRGIYYPSLSSTVSRFIWAAGLGYEISNVEIGIRYQSSIASGAGPDLLGIHLGYNFSLKKKK